MKGMTQISTFVRQGLIKFVGVRAGRTRVNRYFKKKDVEKLQKDRAKLSPNKYRKIRLP
jgi:hypothetical protein